jgi:aerobic carbon-monoxide dehydrogenase large subunit
MNIRVGVDETSTLKFGVGQPVRRSEDTTLVRGAGLYADDVALEGQAHGAFVRSAHAHGVLNGVDAAAALAMPGVLGVFTGRDLEGYGHFGSLLTLPNRDGTPLRKAVHKAFATDRVRFVGDPVALVVATSAAAARDAAEAVIVDIEPLPVVVSAEDALGSEAPDLYETMPGNIAFDYHYGDSDAVGAAFAIAAHVTKLKLSISRIVVNPMEPRSGLAVYDAASGRYTLHVESQGVLGMRNHLAGLMGLKPDRLRVLTNNVGGSFGMKALTFPEYIALLHASEKLGVPVKWTDSRSESFVSDHHGRDMVFESELALDADGRFLATRFTGLGNIGGYVTPFALIMPTVQIVKNSIGMYRTPLIEVSAKCVLTNTVPIGAYRGAGRPEANYFMERLIEKAAREMAIDPVSLRERNMIAQAQLPWTTPAATIYDSGDFAGLFASAREAADWDGFDARKAASERAGKLRGRGIGCFLEMTAAPSDEMGSIHFEADGTVTIITGTLDFGQGHWTSFAQVLHRQLGVPFEKIRLVQGDSDRVKAGSFSGGSKSLIASGTAILRAGEIVIDKGRAVAAHLLEAAAADIEFAAGRFVISGTDRAIGLMEIAERLRAGVDLPPDLPRTLDVDHVARAEGAAFPNGCHIAEIEIDPQTGVTQVDRYVAVGDFGVQVNPLIVEGQIHGGIVQGIGQALFETAEYDEAGQLMSGSFMDYAMPRADDVPSFTLVDRGVPATTNLLGVKGCGEAGCAGSLPSIINAVIDALAPFGVEHIDMPATPQKIWRLIHGAGSR